ncbi:hypothetical protein BDFB_013209 [Asbolus verrucosus]|uniref:Uncharacterized protein n=1 Tax=Asbolus verrucosus TaxID=1661398 RepID=A0A482VR34_ASBVE|nr:hypothetical protein BDFB_013209 [Asbolus verrucosus]
MAMLNMLSRIHSFTATTIGFVTPT